MEMLKQVIGGLIMTMTFINGLLVQQATDELTQIVNKTKNLPAEDWWSMVLGPIGTLVLALTVLIILLRFFYTLQKKSDQQQKRIEELHREVVAEKDKQIDWLKATKNNGGN